MDAIDVRLGFASSLGLNEEGFLKIAGMNLK